MSTYVKLTLSVIGVVVSIVMGARCIYVVNDVADGFLQGRKTEVAYFAKLVRDNWDGIRTVPDEKKEILLKNLNPDLAGVDINVLRTLLLVLVYALYGLVTLLFLMASVSVWKKRRSSSDAP